MKIQALRVGLVAIAVSLLAGAPTAAQERAPGSTTEGIEVHGHWIIEVYDGKELVERREFENGLGTKGDLVMFRVLASLDTPGQWLIGTIADYEYQGTTFTCRLFERASEGGCFESFDSDTQVSVPTSGDNAEKLVLQATRTYSNGNWTVREVGTGFGICANTTAPADCNEVPSRNTITDPITITTLASPIAVQQDQQVNITVIISFTG